MSDKNYEMLQSMIASLAIDFKKFSEKKIKVAGCRVRGQLLDIKKLADVMRKEVLAEVKSMPVKTRKKKDKVDQK